MGEYVGMTIMAALMTTFFLGGWSLPFGLNQFLDGIPAMKGQMPQMLPVWLEGLLSVGVFVGKVVAILFVYVIIRWTLPRFKYNQLMDLGWKRLVPLALANVALVAVIGVLTQAGPPAEAHPKVGTNLQQPAAGGAK